MERRGPRLVIMCGDPGTLYQGRETLPLRSVCSLRGDKRETFHRPGLLAQLAERGADNAKVVSSILTWT